MANTSLESEISFLQNVSLLGMAYEEIAIERMHKTQASVVHSRDYYTDLSQLLSFVSALYKKNKKSNTATRPSVHILLSANNTLYGPIIRKVFSLFVEKTNSVSGDIAIIGENGKILYDGLQQKKQYTFFPLADTGVRYEAIQQLLTYLSAYDTITIYYGKYTSLGEQEAAVISTADLPTTDIPRYLIEPDINAVRDICIQHLSHSLIAHTLRESELARCASRIGAMEKMQEHAVSKMKKVRNKRVMLHKMLQDKQQLQQCAQIQYVKKHIQSYER